MSEQLTKEQRAAQFAAANPEKAAEMEKKKRRKEEAKVDDKSSPTTALSDKEKQQLKNKQREQQKKEKAASYFTGSKQSAKAAPAASLGECIPSSAILTHCTASPTPVETLWATSADSLFYDGRLTDPRGPVGNYFILWRDETDIQKTKVGRLWYPRFHDAETAQCLTLTLDNDITKHRILTGTPWIVRHACTDQTHIFVSTSDAERQWAESCSPDKAPALSNEIDAGELPVEEITWTDVAKMLKAKPYFVNLFVGGGDIDVSTVFKQAWDGAVPTTGWSRRQVLPTREVHIRTSMTGNTPGSTAFVEVSFGIDPSDPFSGRLLYSGPFETVFAPETQVHQVVLPASDSNVPERVRAIPHTGFHSAPELVAMAFADFCIRKYAPSRCYAKVFIDGSPLLRFSGWTRIAVEFQQKHRPVNFTATDTEIQQRISLLVKDLELSIWRQQNFHGGRVAENISTLLSDRTTGELIHLGRRNATVRHFLLREIRHKFTAEPTSLAFQSTKETAASSDWSQNTTNRLSPSEIRELQFFFGQVTHPALQPPPATQPARTQSFDEEDSETIELFRDDTISDATLKQHAERLVNEVSNGKCRCEKIKDFVLFCLKKQNILVHQKADAEPFDEEDAEAFAEEDVDEEGHTTERLHYFDSLDAAMKEIVEASITTLITPVTYDLRDLGGVSLPPHLREIAVPQKVIFHKLLQFKHSCVLVIAADREKYVQLSEFSDRLRVVSARQMLFVFEIRKENEIFVVSRLMDPLLSAPVEAPESYRLQDWKPIVNRSNEERQNANANDVRAFDRILCRVPNAEHSSERDCFLLCVKFNDGSEAKRVLSVFNPDRQLSNANDNVTHGGALLTIDRTPQTLPTSQILKDANTALDYGRKKYEENDFSGASACFNEALEQLSRIIDPAAEIISSSQDIAYPCFLNLSGCLIELAKRTNDSAIAHDHWIIAARNATKAIDAKPDDPRNFKALFRRGQAGVAIGRGMSTARAEHRVAVLVSARNDLICSRTLCGPDENMKLQSISSQLALLQSENLPKTPIANPSCWWTDKTVKERTQTGEAVVNRAELAMKLFHHLSKK